MKKWLILMTALAFVATAFSFHLIDENIELNHQLQAATSVPEISEPIQPQFDIAPLRDACGEEEGIVRMVYAIVEKDDNGWFTLRDQYGNLWNAADVDILKDDFLLMWICDNNTPDDIKDDEVIKIWSEVHG